MDTAGATQVAYNVRTASGQAAGEDLSIVVMIAGNSGRPGGAIYKLWFASPQQRLQGVHLGHRTQEESVVAAWLVGSERTAPQQLSAEWGQLRRETFLNMEKRFLHCLHDKWGMVENNAKRFEGFIDPAGSVCNTHGWPDDVRQRWLATRQGVDYVHSQMEGDYGDAWILPDADLCVELSDGGTTGWRFFKLDRIVRTTLIFVAGPNACPRNGNHMMGSMLRTQNKRCIDETTSHITMLRRTASGQDVNTLEEAAIEETAPFFVACVRAAMRAGLDAAIEAGIDVIVLARISGGIYAGAWHRAMTRDFYRKLFEDLLEESVAITVYDIDPVPNRDTASGQDAAPNPNRDTASGQHEPKIEPGSAHDGSASGQISRGPPSKRRRMDNGEEDAAQGVEMPCDPHSFSRDRMVMPRTMPRGAFFQNVIMPWID